MKRHRWTRNVILAAVAAVVIANAADIMRYWQMH